MPFERQSFYGNLKTVSVGSGIADCDLEEEMSIGKRGVEKRLEKGSEMCPLYRVPEELGMGKGFGYCDMDNNNTTCQGNYKLCEKSYALK